MSKNIIILCAVCMLLSMVSVNTAQAESRTALPNDFGIELLGKAVLYSFSYQRMVTPFLGLQAGLGALGGSDNLVAFVPLGGKVYVIPKDGSPFITGGIVILTDSVDTDLIDSMTYGYAGLGFEYRSQGGFLFRASAYGLFADEDFFIWPGLHIGYAF